MTFKFMFSVHHEAGVRDASGIYQAEQVMQSSFEAVDTFNQQIRKDEQFVFAGGLLPPEAATVVNTDGTHSQGPVSSTRQLVDFWVIEVPNPESALAVADRAARASAVRELPGYPSLHRPY